MPKIFLIKDRLHQQQQKLLESQKRATGIDALETTSLITSTESAGEYKCSNRVEINFIGSN